MRAGAGVARRSRGLRAALGAVLALAGVLGTAARGAPDAPRAPLQRDIAELKPVATVHLGKTADWVAITPDAVWVGSTGPFAVHRIDPASSLRLASVELPGEPCAGLAIGFGSLWVPLCGAAPGLARVDLRSNRLQAVYPVGAVMAEGGVAASGDSIWLVVDKEGSLVRIDPATGTVRQTVRVAAGSYNPLFVDQQLWVTRADGAELSRLDAATGAVLATVTTGPGPRFLTAGAGAIWTLNQGDGSLTRIDAHDGRVRGTTLLGIAGHGGDIGFGDGIVWTTMPKVPLSAVDGASGALLCQWRGPGGDSLGVGHGAIWLTDYDAGNIARIPLREVRAHCPLAGQ